ncbi:hypothetical protein N0V90_007231 [Kalmusia sp. IMI 367209]|nr:hypothetical protein N0V90_007231 [Kalmusia sp. IMI 367209]
MARPLPSYSLPYDESIYMPPLDFFAPTQRAVNSESSGRLVNPDPSARLVNSDITLQMRQEPKEALLTIDGKEKGRKPVDPPPIIQLTVNSGDNFLQSPYLFMVTNLWKLDQDEPWHGRSEKSLCGTLCSSLHRLKDTNNKTGGFFVFGDISVKTAGNFRLHFSLFDYQKENAEAAFLGSIISKPFKVSLPKDFKGMEESTYLSRAFSDQGVRLRLRKEPRAFGGQKRQYSADEDDSVQAPKRYHADIPVSYPPNYPSYPGDAAQALKRFPSDLRSSYPTTYASYPAGYAIAQYAPPNAASNSNTNTNSNPNNNTSNSIGLPPDIWWRQPPSSGPPY